MLAVEIQMLLLQRDLTTEGFPSRTSRGAAQTSQESGEMIRVSICGAGCVGWGGGENMRMFSTAEPEYLYSQQQVLIHIEEIYLSDLPEFGVSSCLVAIIQCSANYPPEETEPVGSGRWVSKSVVLLLAKVAGVAGKITLFSGNSSSPS